MGRVGDVNDMGGLILFLASKVRDCSFSRNILPVVGRSRYADSISFHLSSAGWIVCQRHSAPHRWRQTYIIPVHILKDSTGFRLSLLNIDVLSPPRPVLIAQYIPVHCNLHRSPPSSSSSFHGAFISMKIGLLAFLHPFLYVILHHPSLSALCLPVFMLGSVVHVTSVCLLSCLVCLHMLSVP